MSDKKSVLKSLKDDEIAYVDLRFCDPRGKLQHVTVISDEVDEDFLDEGFMFDGSSIAGWKSIEKSDMKLMPDATSAYVDPFYAEKTLCLHCSVLEPDTNEPYDRDPRGTAPEGRGLPQADRHRRRLLLRAPRPSSSSSTTCASPTRRTRSASRSTRSTPPGTPTPSTRWATWATAPASRAATSRCRRSTPAQDIRSEMLSTMKRIGMKVDKHHHEVASPQHELGMIFGTLTAAGRQPAEVQVRHPERRRTPTARPRPSCRSPTTATTARACTSTCRSGRATSRSSPATSTPTSPTRRSGSSAACSSTPRPSTPSPTRPPTATSG